MELEYEWILSMSESAKPLARLRPLLQTGLTFVAFVICSRLGSLFMIGDGVSVFYPATAVDVVFVMHFGVWGAIGIFLAAMATPWETDVSYLHTAISGLLNVIEGVVPWLWFKFHKRLHRDLVDLRSLFHFLVFGAILNSAISALIGNLYLIEPLGEVKMWAWVTWWLSDFSAAVLLAMPILAFGGWIFDRVAGRDPHDTPRALGNALQITLAIIIIGWSASTIIQNYLSDLVERDRLEQNARRERISSLLNDLERSLIESRIADSQIERAASAESIRSAASELRRVLAASAPVSELEELGGIREERLAESGTLTQYLLASTRLRAALESDQNAMWDEFTARREKTYLVSVLMDQMVLMILLFATVYLLVRVARPLDQLNSQVRRLRRGEVLEADAISSPITEVRNLADTLAETSSSLARKNQALIEQTQSALAASRAKTAFLAKMSHELRTPLNSIIGFSDLMLARGETMSTPKRVEFLQNISRSGRRLLDLINDLLDITKIESGKMELYEKQIDLREPVTYACNIIAPITATRGQLVTIEAPEPVEIFCDPKRIEQVALNLLSNATKFGPEDTPIIVRVYETETMGVVEVEDRGPGVPEDSHQRIFEEFEQAHEGATHGTGLGLALVKRIIELHGGYVQLESGPEGGALFRLCLPRNRS